MTDAVEKGSMTTLLTLPIDLRDRIMEQARVDRRTIKPEILVLLEEALHARERRHADPA